MTILQSLLLAVLLSSDKAKASATPSGVLDPPKYFTKSIRQTVDNAESYSPDATAYPLRYPSVDISSWLDTASSTEEERRGVVHQVLAQAIGVGSFNIIGHNIPVELLERLETSTKKFFSESIDFKQQFSTEDKKAGYKANQEEKYGATIYKTDNRYEREGDLREIFSVIYPPDLSYNVQGPAFFQNPLDEYIEKLQPVEIALMKIFSAALNLAKGTDLPSSYFHGADGGATGSLRALRYPAMPREYDAANRLLPHSDFGTLTIIYGTEKGLEEIRDGKWVEVPINKEKGELHVTVGQMWTMWSNELFAHNIHRVSKQVAKDRISFAYFLGQGQSAPGEGIAPICTGNEVPRFPPTSTALHLKSYIDAMISKDSAVE